MHHSLQLSVLVFLTVAGCATFKPDMRYQDLLKDHRPTATQSHAGLEISAEEFVSADKARKVFDADVMSHGLLAVFLRASNKGAANYRLWGRDAKAFLGDQQLPLLRGIDAADLAGTRNAAGNAAAWAAATGPLFIFFGPAAIAGSGMHSSSVNRDIEHHFDNLEFGNVLLRTNQVMGGFLYFRVPDGFKLQNVRIEIPASEDDSPTRSEIRLTLPIGESRS
jgi:hypothetical protein